MVSKRLSRAVINNEGSDVHFLGMVQTHKFEVVAGLCGARLVSLFMGGSSQPTTASLRA